MIHPYLRTRVGYLLCTTYVQPGISSYVPSMSRLPRYVRSICRYLCTRATSPPQKRTEGFLMKLLQKNKIKINDRNTELCHHRPRSKAHSNEYENNAQTRQNNPYRLGAAPAGVVGARSRCCPAATVPAAVVFACQETCGPHGRAHEFRQDRQPWKIIHDEG